MLEFLLLGLPNERPGGLVLTLIYFFTAAVLALLISYIYAAVTVYSKNRVISLILQLLTATLRGIPLLLMMFFFASLPDLPVTMAGFIALTLYSISHVSEILRGFLSHYPQTLQEQSRLMSIGFFHDWLNLRFVWVCSRALPALVTHWISLLKDTGALVILGIAELTTVAKLLSETAFDFQQWSLVLIVAALLYFITTMALIKLIEKVVKNINRRHFRSFTLTQI